MKSWSELMASVEVLQSKKLILKGDKKDIPGRVCFTLRDQEAYVDFYPDSPGKTRELCRINFTTLKESTELAVKNIFSYINHGILKFTDEI